MRGQWLSGAQQSKAASGPKGLVRKAASLGGLRAAAGEAALLACHINVHPRRPRLLLLFPLCRRSRRRWLLARRRRRLRSQVLASVVRDAVLQRAAGSGGVVPPGWWGGPSEGAAAAAKLRGRAVQPGSATGVGCRMQPAFRDATRGASGGRRAARRPAGACAAAARTCVRMSAVAAAQAALSRMTRCTKGARLESHSVWGVCAWTARRASAPCPRPDMEHRLKTLAPTARLVVLEVEGQVLAVAGRHRRHQVAQVVHRLPIHLEHLRREREAGEGRREAEGG